jgi:hypothetical protein
MIWGTKNVLNLKTILKVTLLVIFVSNQAWAQNPAETEDLYHSRISEYFYNRSGRDVLTPIKLLGSVQKPGLYHIPDNTYLSTLLSIAGGTMPGADTESIIIRRSDGSILKRDLFDVVADSNEVKLATGDIIYIPPKEGLFDGPTGNSVMVLTAILSVVLSGILIDHTIRNSK